VSEPIAADDERPLLLLLLPLLWLPFGCVTLAAAHLTLLRYVITAHQLVLRLLLAQTTTNRQS